MYLEGVRLEACLLHARVGMWFQRDEAPDNAIIWQITFASKSLTIKNIPYSNTEWEAVGIFHGLDHFYHYCSTHELRVITDQQLMIVIFKKDVTSLYHMLQRILLRMHQCNKRI